MNNFFEWIIFNGIMVVSGVLGVVYGIDDALIIFIILAWLDIIMLSVIDIKKVAEELAKKGGFSSPHLLSLCYDILILCLLVCGSYPATAVFYLFSIFIESDLRREVDKIKEKKQKRC